MKLRPLAFVPLAVFGLIGVVLAFGLVNDPRKLPTQMIDREMPEFQLEPVEGARSLLTQETLKGHVSLVNIFGSWCAACVQEHPVLMGLQRSGAIRIYGIAWRDTSKDAGNWLNQYGDPYTAAGLDANSLLAIDLGVTGAPESFILGKKGRIRFKYTGPITPDVWKSTLRPLVQELEQET